VAVVVHHSCQFHNPTRSYIIPALKQPPTLFTA
jgi:hypothetical protein